MKNIFAVLFVLLFVLPCHGQDVTAPVVCIGSTIGCSGNYGTTDASTQTSPGQYRIYLARIELSTCYATAGDVCARLQGVADSDHEVILGIYDDDAGDNSGIDGYPYTRLFASSATYDTNSADTPRSICAAFTSLSLEPGYYWVGFVVEAAYLYDYFYAETSGGVNLYYTHNAFEMPSVFPSLEPISSAWDRAIWLSF
jgi:hypothetical protein